MQLIDTHVHLYNKEFRNDIEDVIHRAEKEGVERFYLPAVDSESHEALVALEARYPGKLIGMMGLHPCSVNADVERELALVESWLAKRSWVAVGEIGLDFYWDRTYEQQQYEAFRRQIGWAVERDIPIVIHSRQSMWETIGVIREESARAGMRGAGAAEAGEAGGPRLRGIFHCFSGDAAAAKAVVELGFYLGIGGVVTYKNGGLAEALADIPLDKIVLETDAPYLSPVPYRGKRNESSYLKYVAAKLAEIKGVTMEEVGRITSENAFKVFGR